MLPPSDPDRIQIAFDDPRLVDNAGLILPVTLAQHLGLRTLVDNHVDLGDAPGRANLGDKLRTPVASARFQLLVRDGWSQPQNDTRGLVTPTVPTRHRRCRSMQYG